jgi:hypothetical protein
VILTNTTGMSHFIVLLNLTRRQVDITFHTLVYNVVLLFCGTRPSNLLFRMFDSSLLSVSPAVQHSPARQAILAVPFAETLIDLGHKLLLLNEI